MSWLICAAFCSGTGLRSRNSQTCLTRSRISELGNSTLSIGVSVRLTNYFALGQLLKVIHGIKEFSNVHSNLDFAKTGDHSYIYRWDLLPISMVLRSERSFKSKMLSLARTSKYVEHQKVRGGKLGLKGLIKLDSCCSGKLIVMLSDRIVVSNRKHLCNLKD